MLTILDRSEGLPLHSEGQASLSGPAPPAQPSSAQDVNYRWVVWCVTYLVVLATLLYTLLPVWIPSLSSATSRTLYVAQPLPWEDPAWQSVAILQGMQLRLMQALTVLWLFFVGACFGSFLNVVVYRVPRGESLWGQSKCPACGKHIRLWHNVPVLGWFWLSGRCYDCRQPISVRYPLVEAAAGTVLLTLAAVEWISGGANLPLRPASYFRGIAMSVFAPQWDVVGIFVFHAALLFVLLSWCLITADMKRIPGAFVASSFVVAVWLVSLFPFFHPVPMLAVPAWPGSFLWGLGSALCGLVTGLLFGTLLFSLVDEAPDWTSAYVLGLAGAALGWQAVFSVILWAAVAIWFFYAVQRWTRIAEGHESSLAIRPFALWLAVAVHLVWWRETSGWTYWPGPHSSPWIFPVSALVAIVTVGCLRTPQLPNRCEHVGS